MEEVEGAVAKDDFLDLVKKANEPQVVGGAESQSLIVRDALGVVVVLAPWNFPVTHFYLDPHQHPQVAPLPQRDASVVLVNLGR